MSLVAGTKLGPYEVVAPLGAGGMGEVYRARDTKLGREVAMKVLPEEFAADAERMARFEREAKVLASLNHPNIASIYGFEESSSTGIPACALVMELVEGQTLAEMISGVGAGSKPAPTNAHAMPLDEALPIAKQIAEGLEYAHERGIVHRDLKPANVKITPDGAVKILDFGLAKAIEGETAAGDISTSPTISRMATQAGIILGTASYMSPEQAKGKTVDRRTDVWAFGCVLYEMLTGKKAFDGETVSDVLAAVIRAEPDWSSLPGSTPTSVRKLLARCLKKEMKQRLQAIGDARITIEETTAGAEADDSRFVPQVAPGARRAPRRALVWTSVAILLCLAGLTGWWIGTRSNGPAPNWSGALLAGPTISFGPRVSPDGHLLAFEAMVDNVTQVAVMEPGSGNWRVLTHDRTHGVTLSLCWSKGGSTIYFDLFNPQPVGIYSVPSLGGEPRLVLSNAAGPEVLPDGTMLVVRMDPNRNYEIFHYWPGTGRLQAMGAWMVSILDSGAIRILPDGKEAVFYGTAKGQSQNFPHLYLLDIATGATRRLAPELPITQSSQSFPLAVTPDGKSVLIDLPSGNLHRIVAIPVSGKGHIRTLLTLTSAPWTLDAGSDGSLYVDQADRPLQILRFAPSGGTPEVLANVESHRPWTTTDAMPPIEFPDGAFLLPATVAGRSRLLLGKPGGNFVSFLQTSEESASPMARVGTDEVAFMAGKSPRQVLALASVKDGRIVHRFDATEGKQIIDVAGSADGKFVYYVSSGTVWAVPVAGGKPRKICAGDGMAVAPDGRSLIVSLNGQEHVRLERVVLPGNVLKPIRVSDNSPLSPIPLGAKALNHEGKLLVSIAPNDSWFYRLGILDLASGKFTRVPLNYTGDLFYPAWSSNGQILATASPLRAHIWRFRPVASGKP